MSHDDDKTDEAMLFEPFFRRRSESIRLQRMQTVAERRVFAVAFDDVGCLRCQAKDRPHAAKGMCAVCYGWYARVLQRAFRSIQSGDSQR